MDIEHIEYKVDSIRFEPITAFVDIEDELVSGVYVYCEAKVNHKININGKEYTVIWETGLTDNEDEPSNIFGISSENDTLIQVAYGKGDGELCEFLIDHMPRISDFGWSSHAGAYEHLVAHIHVNAKDKRIEIEKKWVKYDEFCFPQVSEELRPITA